MPRCARPDARQLVGRLNRQFSKPDKSGHWLADRPGDCTPPPQPWLRGLTGNLSGGGGLTLSAFSNGILELTANNSYSGPTDRLRRHPAVAVTRHLPSGSNLVLDGGIVELAAGDFTRSSGTGSNQVQFTINGGGFAAIAANRVVNLSNSATLTWDNGGFLPNGAPLMLGTASADSTINFQNAIILGSGLQTIQVPPAPALQPWLPNSRVTSAAAVGWRSRATVSWSSAARTTPTAVIRWSIPAR